MIANSISTPTRYLLAHFGDSCFAISIAKVDCVMGYREFTRTNGTPGLLRGYVTVCGDTVPVVDLRAKLCRQLPTDSLGTRIVVLTLTAHGETLRLGTLADSVSGVFPFAPQDVLPVSGREAGRSSGLFLGELRQGPHRIRILDLERIFVGADISFAPEDIQLPSQSADQCNRN